MIANREAENEAEPSSAASGGEVVSEAIAPVSVKVNGASIAVTFDGTVSLVNFQ